MVHCASAVVRISLTCLLLVCFAYRTYSLPVDAPCQTKEGEEGKCTLLTKCTSQLNKMQANLRYRPISCGFRDFEPIVCCAELVARNGTRQPVGKRAEQACASVERLVSSTYIDHALYIINGENTFAGEFPHMASLGYKREPTGYDWFCGGSLISWDFVLTAAHCIVTTRGKPEVVWIGVHNLTQSNQGRQHRIAQDFVHSKYNATANYYDIALLRLQTAAKHDTSVYPACLYTKSDDPTRLVVSGWGTYDEDLSERSDVLLKASLIPVSVTQCNTSYTGRGLSTKLARGISQAMICARGAERGADTCQGDSGGPMQNLRPASNVYDLIGVTSFGLTCGNIGVYTRVSSYIDWIESVVWP